MKRGPFAPGGLCCPADRHYYDPLRLPLGRPLPFPGSPVMGGHRFPPHPQAAGPRRLSPVPETTVRTFNAHIRRRVLRRPLLDQRRLPWPSPWWDRLGTLSSPLEAGCLTTLAQASLSLQTARSLRPASHPASRHTHGGIATGDPDVSPDRTLTGRPSRTCRSGYVMTNSFHSCARAVWAHPTVATAKRRDIDSAAR